MKTGRNILIGAILALSSAGAIIPVAVVVAPAASVVASGPAQPGTHYYG